MLNVLIACEESQRVCIEMRKLGHRAFSCDILECSGGHPEWHIQGDVLPLLNGDCTFQTMDGRTHTQRGAYDLIIAHPPCTYLTVTGNRWFDVQKYGEKAQERYKERYKAIVFFTQLASANAHYVALENPIGIMSTAYGKPQQIIQPYMFGDPYEKKTALWLKNLPPLQPCNEVEPPERVKFDSGKSMPFWYVEAWHLPKDERSKLRSKTFPGIARSMAEQWTDYIEKEKEGET